MNQTTKPIRSKLGEAKQSMTIKYSNPTEVMKQYADVLKITRANNQDEEAELAKDALSTKNLFVIENFGELSDGNDDRIASQSDDYHEQEETAKEVGSTNVFLKLIQELNSIGSLQSVLAISTINQSIDFTSSKFRQAFIAQSGIVSLIKTLQCMVVEPMDLQTHKNYVLQNLQRVEPKVGYEILTILCTLAESGLESRRQLIQEDIIKVAISLAKVQFSPLYTQQTLFRAKVYRLLAACLLISSARNFTRRIQAIPIIIKQFKQAVKDYADRKSIENASLICAISMTIESLLQSKRCKDVLIKQQVVSMLIESLNILPSQITVSDDLVLQTGQNRRPLNVNDMLMESIANNLRIIATVQKGRNDILQANGIRKICDMLMSSKSTKVIQRAVAVLASCAQDSGVDQAVRKAKGLSVLSNQLSSNDFQTLEAICKTIVAVCRSGPFFGSRESTSYGSKEFLSFNRRNEENIVDLCQQDTVNQLGRLINQPKEVLANSENAAGDAIIVQKQGDKLIKGNESRNLCILATNALVPLLSSKRGRDTLRSNGVLTKALVDHLSVGDIEVLVATLHAIYTACQSDIECAKLFSFVDHRNTKAPKLSDAVKAMFSLLQHNNIQVVTAAAMALNPICRDGRAFAIGREIPSALIYASKLLLKDDYDFEKDEFYMPYLVKEQKGWLMGVIAELAADFENAKTCSQYNVLEIVCKLCKEHALPCSFSSTTKPYVFYIDQLIKEKSALALASLSKVQQNMVAVAELQTIPALVRCIQTPDGVSVINFNSATQQFIGTALRDCQNPFGSAVNFSLENQVRRKQEKLRKQLKGQAQTQTSDVDVDKDPQQTPNPYSLVNNAACKAMAELSKNKLCALLLRQYGAIYGLLTLAGSDEADTQESAARAIQNIRLQHLEAMDLYKKRHEKELMYTEEKCGQKPADNIVYRDRVDAAIQQVFGNRDDTSNELVVTAHQAQAIKSSGSFATLQKRNSTLSMLKRNDTADRIHDLNDVEETRDELFNRRAEIKVQQNAQTFTSCVGILKHPEVEEPVDVDQVAKEATVATIDAFLKKQVVEDLPQEQGGVASQQQQRLKPVIKQKPSRAAEPLGWKNPASENERQIADLFKRFAKDSVGLPEVMQVVDTRKIENVDSTFVQALFNYYDNDKDAAIDESQFVEVYKQLQGVGKTGSKDYYDQLFYVMDYMKDDKILPDIFQQFAQKLGLQVQVSDIILKREFREKVPSELVTAFYGKDISGAPKDEIPDQPQPSDYQNVADSLAQNNAEKSTTHQDVEASKGEPSQPQEAPNAEANAYDKITAVANEPDQAAYEKIASPSSPKPKEDSSVKQDVASPASPQQKPDAGHYEKIASPKSPEAKNDAEAYEKLASPKSPKE